MRCLGLAIAVIVATSLSSAGGTGDSSRAGVVVRTSGRQAYVTIDSVIGGYTPYTVDTLPPGRHVLRVLPLPLTRWTDRSLVDTVILAHGEMRSLEFDLPLAIRVSTIPSGAAAWLGSTRLGFTPLVVQPGSLAAGDSLVLRANGYAQAALPRPDTLGGDILIPLRKVVPILTPPQWEQDLPKNGDRPPLRLIAPIAGTVVAGTIAAYYKIHADDINDQYLTYGDGTLLRQVRRYDLISAIALVIAETGMALLAYYLLAP